MSKSPKHRYEVHTYTLCQGWVNCWMVTDHDGSEYPETFETIDAARSEINDFLTDIQIEIMNGWREAQDGHEHDDFRIFDTLSGEYVS